MVRLLVVSDSHGNSTRLQKIIDSVKDYNYIIHCGDGATDLFQCEIPPGVKKIQVLGNVDLWRDLNFEREEIIDVQGYRYLVTHGDLYDVKNGYDNLIKAVEKNKCNGVFFGHTHIKCFFQNDYYLFNPGPSSHGVFGIVDLGEKAFFSHSKIEV